MTELELQNMPKIDLHCHLDGSIAPQLIRAKMKEWHEEISDEELRNEVVAPWRCENLMDYLSRFDLPLRYVQYPDTLEMCAYVLGETFAKEGGVYLETRFAPGTSLREGMTMYETIDAVDRGLKRAEQDFGLKSGIICCAMRHLSAAENLSMAEAAQKAREDGKRVVACDIAGDEAGFPNAGFAYFADACHELHMPMTIHSGEQGSLANIRDAVDFGAKRIGHGIAMRGNKELQLYVKEHGVGVEVCPTSNFQTMPDLHPEGYPLREFMADGLSVSINTDNRTVSDTDSTKELEKCIRLFKLTDEEMKRLYLNAVDMAFADDAVKAVLRAKI